MLLSIDLSNVPLPLIMSISSFLGSYALIKYRMKHVEDINKEQKMEIEQTRTTVAENKDIFFKIREKDQVAVERRFQDVDNKRELLKDILTEKIHDIDKKVSEIHAIIVVTKK